MGPRPPVCVPSSWKLKTPLVDDTSLVNDAQFGGERVALHSMRNFWVDDPLQLIVALPDAFVSLIDEVEPVPPTGANGDGANPSATRKNWFGFGKGTQKVSPVPAAVRVGETVTQAGSVRLALPWT